MAVSESLQQAIKPAEMGIRSPLSREAGLHGPQKPSAVSLPAGIFKRAVATGTDLTPQAAVWTGPADVKMARLLSTLDDTMNFTQNIRNAFSSPTAGAEVHVDVNLGNGAAASSYRQDPHVWFNSPLNSAVDITPYSQIYGVHPRFFNFDEHGRMQVSNCADPWRSPRVASPVAASGQPQFFGTGANTQPHAIAAMASPQYRAAAGHTPVAGFGQLSRSSSFGMPSGGFNRNLQMASSTPTTPSNATPFNFVLCSGGSTPFRLQSATPTPQSKTSEQYCNVSSTAGLNFGSLSVPCSAADNFTASPVVIPRAAPGPVRLSLNSALGGA